jgi:prophage regulatory protein
MTKVFLRRPQVESITGLPTASLYDEMSKGRFPRPIRISARAVAWLEDEVLEWQEQRIAARNTQMGEAA